MTVDTYWWAGPEYNTDCYAVWMIRYERDGDVVRSFCLDTSGQWLEYPEGGVITPCLRVPGSLMHALRGGESLRLHREDFTGAVEEAFTAFAVARKR